MRKYRRHFDLNCITFLMANNFKCITNTIHDVSGDDSGLYFPHT